MLCQEPFCLELWHQKYFFVLEGCHPERLQERERERELRREGGKSLLAYVKGVDPHLTHIDRPTTIRSPEHTSHANMVIVTLLHLRSLHHERRTVKEVGLLQ